MWWKNPDLVTKLSLTADQQKRMDDILQQSRIQLVHIKATLEEQQILLEPMLNANPPDATKTLAQISTIADTRASLEKANAKMLLGIRGVLTADQWTKLQAEQRARRESMRDRGDSGRGGYGPRGPGGPGGPRNRPGAGAPPSSTPPPPSSRITTFSQAKMGSRRNGCPSLLCESAGSVSENLTTGPIVTFTNSTNCQARAPVPSSCRKGA